MRKFAALLLLLGNSFSRRETRFIDLARRSNGRKSTASSKAFSSSEPRRRAYRLAYRLFLPSLSVSYSRTIRSCYDTPRHPDKTVAFGFSQFLRPGEPDP
jgi:hypothetical protein